MDSYFCTLENIDLVLNESILNPFYDGVEKAMEKGIDVTMRAMVEETQGTAPVNYHGKWRHFPAKYRGGGIYAKKIAMRRKGKGARHQAIWYVKAPEYRLSHLLARGHRLFIYGVDAGKRTKADPYIRNARDHAEATVIRNIEAAMPR